MTPDRLGEHLAQFVWESFSDYLEHGPVPAVVGEDGVIAAAEELLIVFLWVHTRACQQALGGRVEGVALKATLDSLHRAVFEDLEAHGIPRSQLPLFEQRVSARYAEFYAATAGGDERVCEVAARRVAGRVEAHPLLVASLAESAVAAAGPLRDFLGEVELVT